MRARLLVFAVVLAALLAGCAAVPPETYWFDPATVVDADGDAVWDAVVEFFAVSALPIKTIEKDSGLIVTSAMDCSGSAGGSEDDTYCDCGEGSGGYPIRGTHTILVKPAVGGGTELRVICTYDGRRSQGCLGLPFKSCRISCSSTGYFEQLVHAYVRAKVEGAATPPVPMLGPRARG